MLKQFLYTSHKWIGLLSGALVIFISLSGALYVFRDDFFESAHKRAIYASQVGVEKMPVDELYSIAQKWFGEEYPISKVYIYTDSVRNYKFTSFKKNNQALTYGKWMEYDRWLYVNPYNGNVEKALNHKWEFTHVIKRLHAYLFLNPKYGRPLVGIVVGIFLLMLITGVIIWWPKPEFRKGSLALIINAPTTAVSSSLHKIFGIYGLVLVLVLALSGLAMVFKLNKPVLDNQTELMDEGIKISSQTDTTNQLGVLTASVLGTYGNAYEIEVIPNFHEQKPAEVKIYHQRHNRRDVDVIKYDFTNKELVFYNKQSERKNTNRWFLSIYDIHVGAIWKLSGKLLALLGSLLAAALPISGFIIWWSKIKTKRSIRQ